MPKLFVRAIKDELKNDLTGATVHDKQKVCIVSYHFTHRNHFVYGFACAAHVQNDEK